MGSWRPAQLSMHHTTRPAVRKPMVASSCFLSCPSQVNDGVSNNVEYDWWPVQTTTRRGSRQDMVRHRTCYNVPTMRQIFVSEEVGPSKYATVEQSRRMSAGRQPRAGTYHTFEDVSHPRSLGSTSSSFIVLDHAEMFSERHRFKSSNAASSIDHHSASSDGVFSDVTRAKMRYDATVKMPPANTSFFAPVMTPSMSRSNSNNVVETSVGKFNNNPLMMTSPKTSNNKYNNSNLNLTTSTLNFAPGPAPRRDKKSTTSFFVDNLNFTQTSAGQRHKKSTSFFVDCRLFKSPPNTVPWRERLWGIFFRNEPGENDEMWQNTVKRNNLSKDPYSIETEKWVFFQPIQRSLQYSSETEK